MARKSTSKRSVAARRGWATRRANAAKRSEAARRGWKTRRKNERIQQKKKVGAQPESFKVRSIDQWNGLDFTGATWIEIAANADY